LYVPHPHPPSDVRTDHTSQHLEQASVHRDDSDDEGNDDVYDSEERSEGWEDKLGHLEDLRISVDQDEEELPLEQEHERHLAPPSLGYKKLVAAVSPLSFRCIQHLRSYSNPLQPLEIRTSLAPILQQSCPICMSTPNTVSATRCGHLFCTP
jgi:E3 ubiquitin-protein ligase RFWD3